jgi:hypothetical protein
VFTKGIALATAAAVLICSQTFATENKVTSQQQPVKPIKCFGVNQCRGRGQCGDKSGNACSGQNACKGKGWIFMSADECTKKGGKPG